MGWGPLLSINDAPISNHHRRIRSYVTRAGRISAAQQRALDEIMPRHGIPYAPSSLAITPPTVLEIGFGMGEPTAEIAAQRPDVQFIGIEVHTPGVGALLKLIEERNLKNLRVIQHDAVEVIENMIPLASLAGIHVYFPDPWHKARHNKRRLIQPEFVRQLAARLAPGGYLHCATDWEDYALQMLEVLTNEPLLVNHCDQYSTPDNPLTSRPQTKFERRGLRLGHGVWDLVFLRR